MKLKKNKNEIDLITKIAKQIVKFSIVTSIRFSFDEFFAR